MLDFNVKFYNFKLIDLALYRRQTEFIKSVYIWSVFSLVEEFFDSVLFIVIESGNYDINFNKEVSFLIRI